MEHTITEIDLIPASFKRLSIQAGVGAVASTPLTVTTTNLLAPALPLIGAASAMSSSKPSGFTGTILVIGSVKLAPVACEYSRAIPLIEKQ